MISHSHTFEAFLQKVYTCSSNQIVRTTGCSTSLVLVSRIKRAAAVQSINSSVLILFFIGKVIPGFLTLSHPNTTHTLFRPQHFTCYHIYPRVHKIKGKFKVTKQFLAQAVEVQLWIQLQPESMQGLPKPWGNRLLWYLGRTWKINKDAFIIQNQIKILGFG